MKNKEIIESLSKEWDSFYLYDEETIVENAELLQKHFTGIEFLYSMKCNPHREVLKTIFKKGFGADAASYGEVKKAKALGVPKEKIFYSAPGKTYSDIENALKEAIIIADSIDEIRRISEIAEKNGQIAYIGIRINPNFTFDGDFCGFNKFGIDHEQAVQFIKDNPFPNIKIEGIHVHLRSQELSAGKMMIYYKKMFLLAQEYIDLLESLRYVNLGSGIGISYSLEDKPIDLDSLGAFVRGELARFKEENPKTKVMFETGRFLTCKSGIYVTKVVDRKISCGKTILVLKNTLNGFIRPSMEQVVGLYAPEKDAAPAEPLFTKKNGFQLIPLKSEGVGQSAKFEKECVTIYGNLCTANDLVMKDVMLPHLEYGDVVVITNAGSYGAVLSPMQFSSHEKPEEIFLTKEGKIIC